MSLLSSFKKALGFPDEYEESELESDTDNENMDNRTAFPAPATESQSTPVAEPQMPDVAPLPGKIFDAVIELFNAQQPEFVARCINTEQQRQYVLEHIDDALRQSIEAAHAQAVEAGKLECEAESHRIRAEYDKLKEQMTAVQRQREEFRQEKISATRQRQALADRIRGLESQVLTLEAEKEQYQLESHSMLNKLRVASVRAAGDSDSEAEAQRLAEENVNLTDRLAEAERQVTDLQRQLRDAEQALAQAREVSPEAPREEKSEEETISAEALDEINKRIEQFEKVKARKDARIAELKANNKRSATHIQQIERQLTERDEKIAKLAAEIESLRSTIENNLYEHARAQADLRDKLEEKDTPETSENEAVKETTQGFSVIDDLMDSTDWFVAPDPTPVKKPVEPDEDFGYKEPVRKSSSRDDEKQLSLW